MDDFWMGLTGMWMMATGLINGVHAVRALEDKGAGVVKTFSLAMVFGMVGSGSMVFGASKVWSLCN